MSVLIYQGRRPENQLRVSHNDVVDYLMSGWFISPYSAINEVK